MKYAVLFPGQGSQHLGMGSGLFEARPDLLGDRADEILGWSLRSACLDGPEEELTRTDRAQPALFALAYALWDTMAGAIPVPSGGAGHSLGEYTALAASGAIGFEDGLRLVAARGAAMASAANAEPSGMAALIGADDEAAEALCAARRASGGRLWVANFNAPGQVVVAGGAEDIEWAADAGADHGIRRVIPLKVAGAFHSPFMVGAATQLQRAIDDIAFEPLGFPIWANTTARPHGNAIADTLVAQLTSPVRFADSLRDMAEQGITGFVHVGPGDVTAGLARKSIPESTILVVSTVADIGQAADALSAVA